MTGYLAIAGTGGGKSRAQGKLDWDDPTSEFSQFLEDHGFDHYFESFLQRYGWSGAVDGIDAFDLTWDYFGKALYQWFVPPNVPIGGVGRIRPEDTYIICHSHAGNLVAYACGLYGLKVEGLITVGMPIRKELYPLYEKAAPNIKRHVHCHAGWRDFWQVLGAIFDGRLGIVRKHPFATRNVRMPGAHGTVLRDPKRFDFWTKSIDGGPSALELFAGRPVGGAVVSAGR